MTLAELKQLLEHVEDTHEIVLRAPTRRQRDELAAVWSAARAEANLAYDAWRAHGGGVAYAAFRAAEDRADAAQDLLATAASDGVTTVTEKVRGLNHSGPEAD